MLERDEMETMAESWIDQVDYRKRANRTMRWDGRVMLPTPDRDEMDEMEAERSEEK